MDEVPLHPTFRPETPGGAALAPGELHVWAVPLCGGNDGYATLLTPAEQERAARFRVADHRRRFAISHGALRAILAGYLGVDALALEFGTGPRGKPTLLADGGPQFNLSHSALLALVAIGHGPALGVDLEKVRHLESLREIAGRHFSRSEFAALEGLPDAERLTAFYRCWTRKEAYVKALGTGLASSLDVFDVSLDEKPSFVAFRAGDDAPADWSLFDVSPGPDYVGALAVRARGRTLRTMALLES